MTDRLSNDFADQLAIAEQRISDQDRVIAHLRVVNGEQAARIAELEKAAQPFEFAETQKDACERYGLEPGHLQGQWRQGLRTDRSELEWAIVDALAMGGVTAWPGDGVGCAARIVETQMDRAEAAEARIAELEAALRQGIG